MPLLLLIPLALGGTWFGLNLVKEAETEATKILIVSALVWLAWINRAHLAKIAKV